jgi:hypothetical protein
MPIPIQPSLLMDSEPYNNRGLFADHFLEDPQRLQAMHEWTESDGLTEAFQRITRLYSTTAGRFNKRTNEAQTEEEFIRRVLDLLWGGDCYQVQPRIPNVDAQRQPDYAFFRSATDRDGAQPRLSTLDYWRDVACLGDAKRWTASLDKERSADENPSAQICNYLYRSRVRWGILCNGRMWRLYEREKSSAGGIYYEVDLEELIKNGNSDRFKYFYLFFRRAAFLPDANGLSFVEKVFQGSLDYAAEVGGRLKESVYDALRLLMNGFFEYGVNQLDRHDSNTLNEVHENALIVLYRLLFLLYAEDRDLLPRKVEPYASNGLYRLQREINQSLRANGQYPPIGRRFWGELTNLFTLIDEGFPEGGIPEYNGGLFSPSKHPQIAHTPQAETRRWEIGDHRIVQVIDMLAYQRERWNEPGVNDIDYNTLDVQHLGSVYEGLLELRPCIASEPMIELLEDGKAVFKATSEVANPRPVRGQEPSEIAAGEVYLVNNRGERKATGSYYTPKYIVDYIVDNAVGSLTEAAAREVETLRPQVEKEIAKLKRKRRELEKTSQPEAANQIDGLDKLIHKQKRQLLEPYLRLRILDPAMGSGHFLVGAADFLSLAMAADPNILPLEVGSGEDPQAFYKRLVVERCLYGVDLNPLSVELAKLSLWLHTVSQDKALSFLDHHLRCGNSLIGASIENNLSTTPPKLDAHGRIKKRDAKQLILGFTETLTETHLQYLLDTFRQIVELMPGDAENERMKDRLYREMDVQREKFRAVANIWLTPYFGVAVSPEQYQSAVAALRAGTEVEWQRLAEEVWFNEAQLAAREKRFFHWELEFPEVFFNPDGLKLRAERGFDAVIGNPPYVDIKGLEKDLTRYLFENYNTARLRINVFASFLEQALNLAETKHGGIGVIIPTAFLTLESYAQLRHLILKDYWLNSIVRLPNELFGQAVGDVKVDTCIVTIYPLSKMQEITTSVLIYDSFKRINIISRDTASVAFEIPQQTWSDRENSTITLVKTEEVDTIDRIRKQSRPLEEHCEFCLGLTPYDKYRGHTEEEIKNKVFHAKSQIDPTYKKLLQSGDVRRYEVVWNGEDWIKYGGWLAAAREQRYFSQERILVQQIVDWSSLRLFAGLTDEELYNTQNQFNLLPRKGTNLKFVLAILNSKLMSFYHRKVFLDVALQRFQKVLIKDAKIFPIRRIEFTTIANERARLMRKGQRLYEQCLAKEDYACVLGMVEHELAQTPERADVIHDLLGFLAERMIEMNNHKQTEVKGFLTWLERRIGSQVEDLSNKMRLSAYHEGNFEALIAVLAQNRSKLKINPNARAEQEAIEREFSGSMAKLTPVKKQIATTD